MSLDALHNEWLQLVEVSGPFLAPPVLREAFPQGLDELGNAVRRRLREAYEEYSEAVADELPELGAVHEAWVDEVLVQLLEFDGTVLQRAEWCGTNLAHTLPEHGVTLAPDMAVVDGQQGKKPLLLVCVYPRATRLEATQSLEGLAITPGEAMVALGRAVGCRLGLVTNGEQWMLIDAPVGAVTSLATWHARLWFQEPVTLRAFVHLLGVRRFFTAIDDQLPALLDRSLRYQDEVTEALGEQVRRAVEVLVQALDRADIDRNRELLRGVEPAELYEAALTVMMRLVFLLAAEERGLLLLGEPRYEACYAVSTLRIQLRAESEEILERRFDAWSRLLATFRAVYAGIEHDSLRLPALGGSLFDPDRFAFLEGRPKGSRFVEDAASPLPIDNRTVKYLLEAIQQLDGRSLSYRALDVEQIGHVYEGLLERTVKRTTEVTLELAATKSAKTPQVRLPELESAALDGLEALVKLLHERTGSSIGRVRNDLAKPMDDGLESRLLSACHSDQALRDRVRPYAYLLRTDNWGYPLVYPQGAFVVTTGSDRRETGTHYTPKSMTEAIVSETLTPVVYVGPAVGTPREQWQLKTPSQLLDLKVCDPAMGSGAFLVQACRWLGDRLVESWAQAEVRGERFDADGGAVSGDAPYEPLARDAESRALLARRLVAERCLYGVDINPLAVELAKLSIWLVTLAKGRPFGFLDHNLRCGDSLLGIHQLDQLLELSMRPGESGQQFLVCSDITPKAVREAIKLRQYLRSTPVRDIRDVQAMAHLDADARRFLEVPTRVADGLIAEALVSRGKAAILEPRLAVLAAQADAALSGERNAIEAITERAKTALSVDLPTGRSPRRPFHWPLEFPEVFSEGGFDAIVGNPPFVGGSKITGALGTAYRDMLVSHLANGDRGAADLVAYFFLRAWSNLRKGTACGLIAVNTIAQGDTRQVGLEAIVRAGGHIYAAYPDEPWSGTANVRTSRTHLYKGEWAGERLLNGHPVPFISAFLGATEEWSPKHLVGSQGIAYRGSDVNGMGFVLTYEEHFAMTNANGQTSVVIYPYLTGEDLNTRPDQSGSRWVICFWDWSEHRAQAVARAAYQRVLELVKPERDQNRRKERRERWWHFAEKTPALYHAIGRGCSFEKHPEGWSDGPAMDKVIVCSLVTKHLTYARVPNTSIFSHKLEVFAVDTAGWLAFLSSNLNEVWARKNSSTLESRLNYSPSDAFETLPLPIAEQIRSLDALGASFELIRASIGESRQLGLTKVYNHLHSPSERSSDFVQLRALQVEIDHAVAKIYGWSDLELSHDFHSVPYLPENDRLRYTISEPARLEILRRLSALNRERYDAEVAKGLHKAKSKKPTKKS